MGVTLYCFVFGVVSVALANIDIEKYSDYFAVVVLEFPLSSVETYTFLLLTVSIYG